MRDEGVVTARKRRAAGVAREVRSETASRRMVWARVGPGRTRRMPRSEAEASGYEIDTRPPRGFGVNGVRREFMNAAEREELFNKTGVRVEDRDDMRKAYKSKDLREAEKGEFAYDQFDALKGNAAPALENYDLWGDEARRPKFDLREAYLRNCQKHGVRPRE